MSMNCGKRLIVSGCHLGDESAGSEDEAVSWDWRLPTGRSNFGVAVGHPIVSSGELNVAYKFVQKCVYRLGYHLGW